MKKTIFILIFLTLYIHLCVAGSPKRELRSTWVATVWGLDWPSTTISYTGSVSEINTQKTQLIQILDSLVAANMNAVFFQVRSRCDAMYNSAYEPWSTDLVATRGMQPGYDPLAYLITEGHKRGIEVHAWVNPYRYETVSGQWTGSAGDYRTAHPDWVLSYSNGSAILDPGRPEVVLQIKKIIGDILNKYDVDGIIFDDYFYAYGGTPASLDATTQALYKPSDVTLSDWRRSNVNQMIKQVYDTIQSVKPYVRFGVSPFGIWTTSQTASQKEDIPLPEGITGGNMYDEIYCDPVAWLKQGTVDYISPQLYWPTGGSQDYQTLSAWWSQLSNRFGKHFYSSQKISSVETSSYAPAVTVSSITKPNRFRDITGFQSINSLSRVEQNGINLFKINSSNNAVNTTQEEIGLQIGYNRSFDENGAPGSVLYSHKYINTKGFINYLRRFQFTGKSIMPAISWKTKTEYGLVTGLVLNNRVLSWSSAGANVKYVIYRIPNDSLNVPQVFSSSKYILGISYSTSFSIPQTVSTATNTFAVAILDRFGNEFPVAILGQSIKQATTVNLLTPVNNATLLMPFDFSWETNSEASMYSIEFSKDQTFNQLFASKELTTNNVSTLMFDSFVADKDYWWRIRVKKPNAPDGFSEVRKFTPLRFKITTPTSGTLTSLTPTFEWNNALSGNYVFEISTGSQFSTIFYSTTTNANTTTIEPKTLNATTTYYARVSTIINNVTVYSPIISFTTPTIIPSVPQFTSPATNSIVFGTSIALKWTEDVSSGYRIDYAKDKSFPARSLIAKTIGSYTYETTITDLSPADYYFRIYASYGTNSYTAWSDTIKVTLKSETSIGSINGNKFSYSVYPESSTAKILDITSNTEFYADIYMYSLTGDIIKSITSNCLIKTGTNKIKIDTTNLTKGLYLIVIKSNDKNYVLKLTN